MVLSIATAIKLSGFTVPEISTCLILLLEVITVDSILKKVLIEELWIWRKMWGSFLRLSKVSMLTIPLSTPCISHSLLACLLYGLMYLVGFLAGWVFWLCACVFARGSPDQLSISFSMRTGAIIGGRSLYAVYDWKVYFPILCWFFNLEGGMSFHGGLLGVLVRCFLPQEKCTSHFLALTDWLRPPCHRLGAGRIGILLIVSYGASHECFLGMVFPNGGPIHVIHPSFMSLLRRLLLFVIYGFIHVSQGARRCFGCFCALLWLISLCCWIFASLMPHWLCLIWLWRRTIVIAAVNALLVLFCSFGQNP